MANDGLDARLRAARNWTIGLDSAELARAIDDFAASVAGGRVRQTIVDEREPAALLARTLGGLRAGVDVFLFDPSWGASERAQALAIAALPAPERDRLPGRIMIATGGTSGTLRFAMHTWETLAAAARGLQTRLGGDPIASYCVLPLHHVSGFMQAVRALETGGHLALGDRGALAAGAIVLDRPERFALSLVPTQLARLLQSAAARRLLASFSIVFLGGAPPWPGVLADARAAGISLAPCYGMTETAAQFMMLDPSAFAAGESSVGTALPHAHVALDDERIVVRAASLALGYYPVPFPPGDGFVTGDRGLIDERGALHVLGRIDDTILSGGEKIAPLDVENALRATGLVRDVAVIGIPDAEWGSAVVALYVADDGVSGERLRDALRERVAPYKIPKRWIALSELARNAQGKLDRRALIERALAATSAEYRR